MPIIQEKMLILVEAVPIEFKSKQTGELVKKWKYSFLDDKGKLTIAYDDNGTYKDRVKTVKGWDEKEAQIYTFVLREFQGITKLQLFLASPIFGKDVAESMSGKNKKSDLDDIPD